MNTKQQSRLKYSYSSRMSESIPGLSIPFDDDPPLEELSIVVSSKAYGLYLGAREHPSSAVLDRGFKHRTGATVSSRMAQSRCGSAGELLAWRPDRSCQCGTRGLNGCEPRGHTGPLARECSVQSYNKNSDAILESTSKRLRGKTLKWHYSRPL